MRRANSWTAWTASLAAGALLLVAACGDDAESGGSGSTDPTDPADPSVDEVAWPGDGSAARTVDLGEGLVAELPVGWEVTPFAPLDDLNATDCAGPRARLATGAGAFRLELNPVECDVDRNDDQIGNGFHGIYVTLDDVPSPAGVQERNVAAGSLVTFTQSYFECTNECNDYDDNVGLLQLDAPPDPGRPTVVLLDDKGELPMDGLVAVAEAIRPA